MQPTIQAINEILLNYGDKLNVKWVDLETTEGADYFKENGLSAHLNVIINGSYEYTVEGRDVLFQWFEGEQWTKEDLDTVISSLLGN